MFVKSWMSKPAVSVDPDASIVDAGNLMEKNGIRRLLAVDSDGKLVGIVTRSDLQAAVGRSRRPTAQNRKATRTRVGNVMTRKPLTVQAGDTLELAAQLMLRKAISGLPVVEDDRLVGIITESDIFRAFCAMLGFNEGGARVVLSLDPEKNLLEGLQRAVGKFSIRGLVCYHRKGEGRWEAVVRLKGRRPAHVEAGL